MACLNHLKTLWLQVFALEKSNQQMHESNQKELNCLREMLKVLTQEIKDKMEHEVSL